MFRYKYLSLSVVLIIAVFVARMAVGATISTSDRQTLNPDAPPETEALGQLAGRWAVRMEIRDGQGKWHVQDTHREWHWYYILDGHAIQDDLVTIEKADRNDPQITVGTNIRIYNEEEQLWHMAWIHSGRQRLATFTATNQDDRVVMQGMNDQGREVRNTFFDIRPDSFEWEQRWTFDAGESWVAVARIHATRIE
jgi:hypothetical protein